MTVPLQAGIPGGLEMLLILGIMALQALAVLAIVVYNMDDGVVDRLRKKLS